MLDVKAFRESRHLVTFATSSLSYRFLVQPRPSLGLRDVPPIRIKSVLKGQTYDDGASFGHLSIALSLTDVKFQSKIFRHG